MRCKSEIANLCGRGSREAGCSSVETDQQTLGISENQGTGALGSDGIAGLGWL